MTTAKLGLGVIAVIGLLLCQPVTTLAQPATPINCSQFAFTGETAIVSAGERLFRFARDGWEEITLPGSWQQVQVTAQGDIYLYDPTANTVYWSNDSGLSWLLLPSTPFTPEAGFYPGEIYPSPVPEVLFLWVWQRSDQPGPQTHLWRSLEGGVSWSRIDLDSDRTYPNHTPVVFSADFTRDATVFMPDIQQGSLLGILKSTNSGTSWRFLNDGLQTMLLRGSFSLVVSPTYRLDQTVFTASGSYSIIQRSTDGGEHWSFVDTKAPVRSLAASPVYALDRQLLIGTNEVYLSTDGGASQRLIWDEGDPKEVGITRFPAPLIGSLQYWIISYSTATNWCNLYRSSDGGQTWQKETLYPRSHVVSLPMISR